MSKFKMGDTVIPEGFEREDIFFGTRLYGFVGKPGTITDKDYEPEEHRYRVHGCWWPEGAIRLAEPQTLVAEPAKKTLGDFMLAALTGLCANEEGRMKILKDSKQEGISINQGIAKTALEIAKATINELNKEA